MLFIDIQQSNAIAANGFPHKIGLPSVALVALLI
jgi:hypothetical protein